jgi:ribosomal protein S18 acetylase RimI-like enzyme
VSIAVVPSSGFTHAELADLFTASFEGYAMPMEIDEPTFRRMAELFDFDLDASRVALRGGRPIGLVNLGVRKPTGWIGGMGVIPDERRRGIGELLMRAVHHAARERGVRESLLEVIDSNAPAIALYEKLGYVHVRDLELWRLDSGATAGAAREVPAADAHARVRELRLAPEPWQRADVVMERVLAIEPRHGLETAGGAAVLRVTGQAVVVEQIAARDAGAARELLAGALRLGRPVRLTNLPAGDPVGDAFRELGASLDLRQHELRLEL